MKNKIQLIDNNNPATSTELRDPTLTALAECEETIQHGFATFVAVGAALLRIRDEQLYRLKHRNFGEYCQKRWKFGKGYANRLAVASQISRELAPIGAISHEFQVRPLLRLNPDQRRHAWAEALKSSPIPTQLQVRAAARRITGEISNRSVDNAKPARSNFARRCQAFCERGISEARNLVDNAASCDLREALLRLKSDFESCHLLLEEGMQQGA
jgi:hypothetical protein